MNYVLALGIDPKINRSRRQLISPSLKPSGLDTQSVSARKIFVSRGHNALQVVFIISYDAGNKGLEDSVATKVYQAVRVLRLIRFTSLLRRLYATAAAAQSSILPGLHVSLSIRHPEHSFNSFCGAHLHTWAELSSPNTRVQGVQERSCAAAVDWNMLNFRQE